MTTEPKPATVRKLFALSGNRCAFRDVDTGAGCEQELARPAWPRTQGEIAHIAGEKDGAARWDASMTDDQRRAYENLLVMCPTHHNRIDYLEPEKYIEDVLLKMKQDHEAQCPNPNWASDPQLSQYAGLVLVYQFGVAPSDLPSGASFKEEVGTGATFGSGTFGAATFGGGGASQVIEPEGVPIAVVAGDAAVEGQQTRVDGSTAIETDSANPGAAALTMEDGTPILTEAGDRIVLESETAGE